MALLDPINIVQITDTHLYGTPSGTLLKMNTQDSLDHVIKTIKQHEDTIDLILATGDIAQDASEQAYRNFLDTVKELDAPVYWIPGNHDDASLMAKIAEGSSLDDKIIELGSWRIVMLDSSIEGQVHGRLAPSELDYLEKALQEIETDETVQNCLVCMHHNPVPGTAQWMKDIGLHNGEEFFDTVLRYNKVNAVLYAHIHQTLDFKHRGLRCLCTPSTCIQFKPGVTNFELDRLNPGYRAMKLMSDGTIETEVHRVSGYTFEADYHSVGY